MLTPGVCDVEGLPGRRLVSSASTAAVDEIVDITEAGHGAARRPAPCCRRRIARAISPTTSVERGRTPSRDAGSPPQAARALDGADLDLGGELGLGVTVAKARGGVGLLDADANPGSRRRRSC